MRGSLLSLDQTKKNKFSGGEKKRKKIKERKTKEKKKKISSWERKEKGKTKDKCDAPFPGGPIDYC